MRVNGSKKLGHVKEHRTMEGGMGKGSLWWGGGPTPQKKEKEE